MSEIINEIPMTDSERRFHADLVRKSLGECSVLAGMIDGSALIGVTDELGLGAVRSEALAEIDERHDREMAELAAEIYATREASFMSEPSVQKAIGSFCQVMDTYASTMTEIRRRVDELYNDEYWSDGDMRTRYVNDRVGSIKISNGNTVRILGVKINGEECSGLADAIHAVVLAPADSDKDAEVLMSKDLKEMRPVFDMPRPTKEEVEADAFESYAERLGNIAADNALHIDFWEEYFKAQIREGGTNMDTGSLEGRAITALYPHMDFSTGRLYGEYSDAVVTGATSKLDEDGVVNFEVTVRGDGGLGQPVKLTRPIFNSADWRLGVETNRTGWELVAYSEQVMAEGGIRTQVEWGEPIPGSTKYGQPVMKMVEDIMTGKLGGCLTDIAWVRGIVKKYGLAEFVYGQES